MYRSSEEGYKKGGEVVNFVPDGSFFLSYEEMGKHPDEQRAREFAAGVLEQSRRARIAAWSGRCPYCKRPSIIRRGTLERIVEPSL